MQRFELWVVHVAQAVETDNKASALIFCVGNCSETTIVTGVSVLPPKLNSVLVTKPGEKQAQFELKNTINLDGSTEAYFIRKKDKTAMHSRMDRFII